MTKVRNAALALAVAGVFAAPSAMAQGTMDSMTKALTGPESGWYVGGGIGQSKIDVDLTDCAGCTADDKDTAFRVFGGYQINKHFGVELGYSELGEATIKEAGSTDFKVEAKVFDLVAVGTLPIGNNFALIGKLGFYKGDLDGSGGGESVSESSTELTYAIGAQYNFNKNLGIRAEWQQFKDMGKKETVAADVDVMSISVVYKFK